MQPATRDQASKDSMKVIAKEKDSTKSQPWVITGG